VVLEFESFLTLRTLELAKHGALIVAYHVALQAVHVRKCLVTHLAGLLAEINSKQMTHCRIAGRNNVTLCRPVCKQQMFVCVPSKTPHRSAGKSNKYTNSTLWCGKCHDPGLLPSNLHHHNHLAGLSEKHYSTFVGHLAGLLKTNKMKLTGQWATNCTESMTHLENISICKLELTLNDHMENKLQYIWGGGGESLKYSIIHKTK